MSAWPRTCPDCEGPIWGPHPTCLDANELARVVAREVQRIAREGQR